MRTIVAQSSAHARNGLAGYVTALCDLLESKGHKTERLDLPPIAAPGRALTNVASLRLLGTAASADVLICLDPVAAVLRHPRKMAWLLDHSYLDADQALLSTERAFDSVYLANVLRSSLEEAEVIFSPSLFALQRLRAQSFDRARLLQPGMPGSAARYPRNPGFELLVLDPLEDLHRPELLIACLAALPEPFRARWVASSSQPDILARLRRQAEDAGVEQRLAIDVRAIDAGEKAHLLANAAVLVALTSGAAAITDTVHDAVGNGVPVITCIDGGALTEIAGRSAPQPQKPFGAKLAKAVLVACAALDKNALDKKSSAAAKSAKPRVTGWSPLLKALSK